MSVHISPRQRAEQFPGELLVTGGRLVCAWCNAKPLNHRRRDQILDHIRTKSHQDNRISMGAKMSYDPMSEEALLRKKRRRLVLSKMWKKPPSAIKVRTRGSEDNVANLRKLFQDSDSDSATSFEGFQSPPSNANPTVIKPRSDHETADEQDDRRSGRPRKRPARLSESYEDCTAKIDKITDQAAFISSMSKKRRSTEDHYSPPTTPDLSPAKILPKQINASYSDSAPSPGSLKVKISLTKGKQSKKCNVKSDKNLKVVSKSGPGKGLKLKFFWNKKSRTNRRSKMEIPETNSAPEKLDEIKGYEETEKLDEMKGYEEMLRGIEGTVQQQENATAAVEEIVEEEIVEMNEEELVTEEDIVPFQNDKPNQEENDIEVLAPAKTSKPVAVPKRAKSKFVSRRQQTKPKGKKQVARDVKKQRKMTGYMMWAKQTRESVSRKYPGLEFGDVSKKLGLLWKRMPEKEKQMWKYRNTKLAQNKQPPAAGTLRKSGSKMIETGPKKKTLVKTPIVATSPPVKNPEAAMQQELSRLPPPSTEPLDTAAYLSLLGESFSKLSAKTRKLETRIVIQGAETVLLDSLVCALAPLISLTRQIPELNDAIDQRTLSNCFSNIAHIMPGL